MNKVFLMILVFILSGCYNDVSLLPIQTVQESNPHVNKSTTCYLGDEMLSQYTAITGKKLFIKQEKENKFGNIMPTYIILHSGWYAYRGSNSNKFYYTPIDNEGEEIRYNTNISYTDYIIIDSIYNKIGYGNMNSYNFDLNEVDYKVYDDTTIAIPNKLQQIIEYAGKEDKYLKFIYKEFIDNKIRNAFTSTFTLDITDTDTLVYKGAIIKVDDYDGNSITYRVLKNFNTN